MASETFGNFVEWLTEVESEPPYASNNYIPPRRKSVESSPEVPGIVSKVRLAKLCDSRHITPLAEIEYELSDESNFEFRSENLLLFACSR